jgi:hypothetical protein
MNYYPVLHGKIYLAHADVREVLEELYELHDREIAPPMENMQVLGWLFVFFLPHGNGKFVPIDKATIGASRWLLVKMNKMKSDGLRQMYRDLLLVGGNGHVENHDAHSFYMILNRTMRAASKSLTRAKTRRLN